MGWPHSTHTHSTASTAPTDWYSEVVIVHTCAFQSTLLGCQVTSVCTNCSHYINSGWTFCRQTLYIADLVLTSQLPATETNPKYLNPTENSLVGYWAL